MDAAKARGGWCAGLPIVGERALSDVERADLTAGAARDSRRALVLILASAPAAAVIAVPLVALVSWCGLSGPCGEVVPILCGIAALLGAMFTFGAAILLARDKLESSGQARRDLAENRVRRYSGTIPFYTLGDEFLVELLQGGLLFRDDREQSVEVLDPSGRLWTVNGVRVPEHRAAETWNAPTPGPETARAAARVRPDFRGDSKIHTAHRVLSEFEKAEILDLARIFDTKARSSYLWQAFVACLWTLGALGMETPTRGQRFYGIVAAVAGLAWLIVTVWRWFEAHSWTSALRVDVTAGKVAVTREQTVPPAPIELDSPAVGDFFARSGPLLAPEIEHLPFSGTVWSVDGRPARWRGGAPDDSAA